MPKRRRDPSTEPEASEFEAEPESSEVEAEPSPTSRRARRTRRTSGPSAQPQEEEEEEEEVSSFKWLITLDLEDHAWNENGKKHHATRLVYTFQSLGSSTRFSIVEDISAEARAAADLKGFKKVGKGVKNEIKKERAGKIEQVQERLRENADIEEAGTIIEEIMGIQILRGYDGPVVLGKIVQTPGWALSLAGDEYIKLDPALFKPDQLPPATDIDQLFENLFADAKPRTTESWRDYFNAASDQVSRIGQLILQLLAQLDTHYRATRFSPPSSSQRGTDLKNAMKPYCYGGETSLYSLKSALRTIRQPDNVEIWRVHVMVSSSPENNPEGNPDISSHFRLDEFCELGEDAAKFDEAGACFQRDVEKLIEEANEKVGGMDIDDFKERMDALRPAGHDRERGGGRTTFEYPHRPAAVWFVRRALISATGVRAERNSLKIEDPLWTPIFEGLVQRVVRDDPDDPKQLVVRDEYTGEVLVRTSKETIQWNEWFLSRKGKPSPISIDHLNQVIVELQKNGEVEAGFHSLNNVVVTSPLLNNAKHRYPSSILDLYLAIVAVGGGFGYLTKEMDASVAIERLIKVIETTYQIWPISCIHSERRLQAVEVIVKSDEYNREMSEKVGSFVPLSIKSYPNDEAFMNAVAKASDATNTKIRSRIERAFLSEDYQGSLPVSSGLTQARPARRETVEVHSFVINNVKKVGERFKNDAESLGISLLLNKDGIPSVRLDGEDTAEDIARACVLVSADLGGYFPWMNYALLLASNITRCDQTRLPGQKIENLLLTSGHLPCVPFVVPTQNKGPFSFSPSRRDHKVQGYDCGFQNKDADTVCLADYSGKPSYYIDAWLVNSILRGDSQAMKQQLEALRTSAATFINSDRGNGMKWLFKNGKEWGAEEEKKKMELEESLAKWEKWDADAL